MAHEGTATQGTHELAKFWHERNRLPLVLHLGFVYKSLEVIIVDLLLAGEILVESLASKETIQTLAVIDVSLPIEEDPVLRAEKLVGGINDARLDKVGRIEDFAGHVASRGDDDKPTKLVSTCSVAI